MKLNVWVKYFPNFLLHRGTIFGPNKIRNRLTNWMCRRRFMKQKFVTRVGFLSRNWKSYSQVLNELYLIGSSATRE